MKAVLARTWRLRRSSSRSLGGHWRVYAFEADETNYTSAKTNVEMAERVMGLENIILFRALIA